MLKAMKTLAIRVMSLMLTVAAPRVVDSVAGAGEVGGLVGGEVGGLVGGEVAGLVVGTGVVGC